MRENIILTAQIYSWIIENLILNFMYIHSKRRKLGTFILFQKCQFAYPFKQSKFATSSQISFIFNFWSRDMSRDNN